MLEKLDGPFKGRTVNVVRDLNKDEQLYLYQKARELKELFTAGDEEGLDRFRINNNGFGAYMMFFENSTRTKESFRNAAKFHNIKLNDFDVQKSSFQKKEGIIDTVKMLYGYSQESIFIIRSTKEGVCRALGENLAAYANKINYPKPSFLNAGDGKHEHPTQEFLDEFSFLEKKNWDNSKIHIALIGDLFHGRTVHSKVDGLNIFRNVRVDLIAPDELALPDYYEQRMVQNGFRVRNFPSIEAYLAEKDRADIWYFTRLQLERMGDEILGRADFLRNSVTFKESYLKEMDEHVRFYHPLPRHRIFPVIPHFLDQTPLNSWDEQSINGFFTRVILIGMVSGKLGSDFEGKVYDAQHKDTPFIEEVQVTRKSKVIDRYKVGIKPVDQGIVIDHIARGEDLEVIWDQIDKIRKLLHLNCRSSHGVYHTMDEDKKTYKGIISLPDVLKFSEKDIKKLAAVSPGCTLNIIEEQSVKKKFRLHMPPRIFNFRDISCKNENCISHPALFENVDNDFFRTESDHFKCKYCEKTYTYKEIWDI